MERTIVSRTSRRMRWRTVGPRGREIISRRSSARVERRYVWCMKEGIGGEESARMKTSGMSWT
jgi:hypothetical protein